MVNLKSQKEVHDAVQMWIVQTHRQFVNAYICPSDVVDEVLEDVEASTKAHIDTEFAKLDDEFVDGGVINIDSGNAKDVIDDLSQAVWDGLGANGFNGSVKNYDLDFIFTVYGESELADLAEEHDMDYPPESDEDREYLVQSYFDNLVDLAVHFFEADADKLPEYVRNN